MRTYTKQSFKLSILLFCTLVGLMGSLSLMSVRGGFDPGDGGTSYHYARQTWIRHEYWVLWVLVRHWGLYTNCRANYMNQQGNDIYSWSISGSGTALYSSDWETFGYSSSVTTHSEGGYYTWVKHSNSAHFETVIGDIHFIVYGMQKIKEGYLREWSASWEQLYGGFCWISSGDILISSH